MLYLTIFSLIGSICSIASLAFVLKKYKVKAFVYILLVSSVSLSALTAFLTVEVSDLKAENHALLSAKKEAEEMIASWKMPHNVAFVSRGEARGIIISGLIYLEKYKDLFPEAYKKANELFLNLGVAENRDSEWWDEMSQLQQGAETMRVLINSAVIKQNAS